MPFAQPFPVQLRQRSEQSSQFQFRMDGGASFRCAPLAFEGAGVSSHEQRSSQDSGERMYLPSSFCQSSLSFHAERLSINSSWNTSASPLSSSSFAYSLRHAALSIFCGQFDGYADQNSSNIPIVSISSPSS